MHEEMVAAMRANDESYNGRFYVGVHSTGIFCLPSCPARLPKIQNVRFYPSREAAMATGLRACLRCHPERFPHLLPEWLDRIIEHMRAHPDQRLDESALAERAGVDISTVRRYFRRHRHTTPLAFHRRLRMMHARELIESGTDYLNAAYECGYESASGFRDAFVREFGTTPGSIHVRH